MSQTEFLEIETKYAANAVTVSQFNTLITTWKPKQHLNVSGWDYYFMSTEDPDDFIRYRASPTKPQLTMKRKTKDGNNYVRIELNVPLGNDANLATITAFCELLGFKFNFQIWKTCWIYWFDKFNVVYYIVGDNNLTEQDRFMEIEMDEEHPWINSEEAWAILVEVEKRMTPLGVSPQARLKKSLYERFRVLVRS